MAFDPRQTTPWPLWRRIQIGAGITFSAGEASMSLKEWAFAPHFVLTLPGQPVTPDRANIPNTCAKGAFWAIKGRQPHEPMLAGFFWLQVAVRICGFDIGFEAWYRLKGSHA